VDNAVSVSLPNWNLYTAADQYSSYGMTWNDWPRLPSHRDSLARKTAFPYRGAGCRFRLCREARAGTPESWQCGSNLYCMVDQLRRYKVIANTPRIGVPPTRCPPLRFCCLEKSTLLHRDGHRLLELEALADWLRSYRYARAPVLRYESNRTPRPSRWSRNQASSCSPSPIQIWENNTHTRG
jgi:hypothetical protein